MTYLTLWLIVYLFSASVAQLDAEVAGSILSLPLIQEGQLSVSGEECAQY